MSVVLESWSLGSLGVLESVSTENSGQPSTIIGRIPHCSCFDSPPSPDA